MMEESKSEQVKSTNFSWKTALLKFAQAVGLFIVFAYLALLVMRVLPGGDPFGIGYGLAYVFYVLPLLAIISAVIFSTRSERGMRWRYFLSFLLFICIIAAVWILGMYLLIGTSKILSSSTTMCRFKGSQPEKDACYNEQARNKKDLKICEQSSTPDNCVDAYYFDLSRVGNNIDFCKQSPRPDKCFYNNIKFRADYNLFLDKNIETYKPVCNSISGVQLKDDCVELLNENLK